MACVDFDVIVAGGGVAGISAAAALKEFGWSVLIVEPGQHDDRRLAGELIHPAGIAALTELGLCSARSFEGAIPIRGFVAFSGVEDGRGQVSLPYIDRGSSRYGFALDHARIRSGLQASVAALPNVETLFGGRIVGIDEQGSITTVAIMSMGVLRNLDCRLVIAADGAASAVRGFAGIAHTRRPISKITGYVITDRNLPIPGFGHVFIGSLAPLLVYEIGNGSVRVLFDQPIDHSDVSPMDHRARIIDSIPHAHLRDEIVDAVKSQRGLSFMAANVMVDRSTRGRIALIGDASGSCHPLTATGMTIGATDALRLRDAFRDSRGDVATGLELYGARRKAPQRSRVLVASALHGTCSGRSQESRLIRSGLIRYWMRSDRGRLASMAILAMSDVSFTSAVYEMILVILHGFAVPLRRWSFGRFAAALCILPGLVGVVVRQTTLAMRAK